MKIRHNSEKSEPRPCQEWSEGNVESVWKLTVRLTQPRPPCFEAPAWVNHHAESVLAYNQKRLYEIARNLLQVKTIFETFLRHNTEYAPKRRQPRLWYAMWDPLKIDTKPVGLPKLPSLGSWAVRATSHTTFWTYRKYTSHSSYLASEAINGSTLPAATVLFPAAEMVQGWLCNINSTEVMGGRTDYWSCLSASFTLSIALDHAIDHIDPSSSIFNDCCPHIPEPKYGQYLTIVIDLPAYWDT